ncbi:MerR family transcriptional regulator [Corynebacterium sp. HMSC075D04]|uniref:MerR family transcriptional regulator n=1 Tax=Corynebacterium sp. HMSC075D04 TaxID=1739540 RepID=UPI0008A5FCD5|nr:MerR family transcriptional regulator [Corynebacterium sp. HMSC075D04]OFO36705.1 MerR family transcriptional regulator [Corynebacterium sp. HMSC075D04]
MNDLNQVGEQETTSAAVQESLFDVGPSDEVGYRVPIACQVAGITYRQLDYWARTGLVRPSIRGAKGSGSQRLYSFKDILVLKIVKGLLDTGISLQNIRLAVDKLRDRGVSDIAEITLVSDGVTVYECRSNEEIIDLLGGGQGVFGIAVPQIMKELTGTISAFPSERVEDEIDAPNVIGFDELADRRRRKTS